MGKYKITIVGEGPHHTDEFGDADAGAKSLVIGLKMSGHTIHDARFEGDKPPEDINVDVPEDLKEPAPASEPALVETAGEADTSDGAAATDGGGTGDDAATDPA